MKRLTLLMSVLFFIFVGSASSADTLELRLIQETNSTITLGWTPQPGYGYLFSADGKLVSRTYDANRSTVKFSKNYTRYEVAVDVKGAIGTWPPPVEPPPPPPPPPPSGTIAVGQSWQAAYDAAPAGATLNVATGNHGAPALTGTKAVTFLGSDGALVTKMPGNASNVTFQNIDIDTGNTHGYGASELRAANITWRDVNVRGAWASLQTYSGASGWRWLGGSLNAPGQRNCSTFDGQPVWVGAGNATIDGVTFGVFDSGDCGSQGSFHMEAIRIQGVSDIRILNVTFSENSDTGSGHIFVTTTSPTDTQPRRLTIDNTIFPRVIGSYAIQVHSNVNPIDGWVVRRSRFDQGVLNQAPFTNLTACGNTGSVPSSWMIPC